MKIHSEIDVVCAQKCFVLEKSLKPAVSLILIAVTDNLHKIHKDNFKDLTYKSLNN